MKNCFLGSHVLFHFRVGRTQQHGHSRADWWWRDVWPLLLLSQITSPTASSTCGLGSGGKASGKTDVDTSFREKMGKGIVHLNGMGFPLFWLCFIEVVQFLPEIVLINMNSYFRLFIVCHPSPPPIYALKDVFGRFGNLIDIYMLNGKTFGYAKYASKDSADKAIVVCL